MNSNYISNIIPRLKKFAQNVEIKEEIVDKVWVIYGDTDLIEYEFERSGEIAVTKNGDSYDGSWKILGSGRLKIKTDFANNTLEYDFFVPGIMVMKIGGLQNKPFLLFDPNVVENGNVRLYLESLEANGIQLPRESPTYEIDIDDGSNIIVIWAGFFIIILICLSLAFGKT